MTPDVMILFGKINHMKKIFEELNWIWDYYFAYFLYNDRKRHRYDAYMSIKWGDRYKRKP